MIILNKKQHDNLINLVDDLELKDKILNVSSLINEDYHYDMDDDLEIDLYDFLQDKQVQIGYDEGYNPNSNWEDVQKLIDELYYQIENN
ncbi:MAG: DUF1128 family protein [Clostridiales bacterium]|nr:DUF1128 family protein [Clostridiales bacterium]